MFLQYSVFKVHWVSTIYCDSEPEIFHTSEKFLILRGNKKPARTEPDGEKGIGISIT